MVEGWSVLDPTSRLRLTFRYSPTQQPHLQGRESRGSPLLLIHRRHSTLYHGESLRVSTTSTRVPPSLPNRTTGLLDVHGDTLLSQLIPQCARVPTAL